MGRTRCGRGLLVAGCMLVVSCGSGSSESGFGERPDIDSDAPTADLSDFEPTGSSPAFDRAIELGELAIEEFGSDAEATAAVLRASDGGYDGDQIAAAIRSSTLRVDGTIDGATPLNAPSGLIVGFRAPQPTPLEQLQRAAEQSAMARGVVETDLGGRAVILVMVLVDAGLSGPELVEALILGVDFGEVEVARGRAAAQQCLREVEEGTRDLAGRDPGEACQSRGEECARALILGGEPRSWPGCPDPPDPPTVDGDGAPAGSDPVDDPPAVEDGGLEAFVGAYRFVPSDTEYNEEFVVLAGSFDLVIDGDVLRGSGSADIDNTVVSTNVQRECWDLLTMALAVEQVALDGGVLFAQLAFTSADAASLGEAGFGCSEGFRDQSGRIADLIESQGIVVELTSTGGVVSGATFDGSVVVEPA